MIRSRLKPFVRRLFSGLVYYSGYCAWTSQGAHILCYHDITDHPASPFAVSTRDFADQMRFLVQNCAPVSVNQLVNMIRQGRPIPPRAIAVTIDDGYLGVYTRAYPILKDYAIPATIFLPTRCLDRDIRRYVPRDWAQAEFMTWDQARVMASGGIAFGSHTLDHLSLPTLEPAQIMEQLAASKARIEAEIGQQVDGFSYPYGLPRDYRGNERYVAEAGYTWAVTGVHGSVRPASDVFALRRVKVEKDDGMRVFRRLVRGAMDPWQIVDSLRR